MAKQNNAQVTSFIDQFKQAISIADMADKLKEGDWDGLVAIAKEMGFELSKAELVKNMPADFFLGQGKDPTVGWRKDYHAEDTGQTVTAQTIWTTYENQSLLQDQMQQDCYDIILDIVKSHNLEITDGQIHHDQVQLSIKYPIHESFGKIVAQLKSETSVAIKVKYPELDDQLNKMPLWQVK